MARPRKVKFGKLNVAMHSPHSSSRYVELFALAHRLGETVDVGGAKAMMINLYNPRRVLSENGLVEGEIFRFVKIDPNEPWFNKETREEASDTEVRQINIPEHLLPHLNKIPFVFNPVNHVLWYVSKDRSTSLGPNSAERFFQALFSAEEIGEEFPPVEVTAFPDHDSLRHMLNLPRIKKMVLSVKRPNSDDGDDLEEEFQRRLEEQHAGRLRIEYSSVRGQSFNPDDRTRAQASFASRNGYVSITAEDASGASFAKSTKDQPFLKEVRVNEDIEPVTMVLQRQAGA